jgi:hypothetical protein
VRSNGGGADQSRLQTITRMANDVLRSAGIDPAPRPDAMPDSDAAQAARFHRALQDELWAFESKGRSPTEAEAYDIVNGLKSTGIKGGWLKVRDRPASPTMASDIPEDDDAFHKDGAEVAQAGPGSSKPPSSDSEPSGTEQELGTDAGRLRQLNGEEAAARSAVRGNMTPVEIDRWISDWLSSYRPEDAAPPQMPAGLAERLTPGQKTEIENIVSGGADTKTDRQVFEEIQRGLRSGDLAKRLEWANKPLYRYRPLLSPHDYEQLTIEQAQIDPRTGAMNGAVGHPFGTLDQHAALAIELSAARGVAWAYRAGRWVLDKITESDNAPAGRDVVTSEGLNAPGLGGGAAKAAESALSTNGNVSSTDEQPDQRFGPLVDTADHVERSYKQISEKVFGYLLNSENEAGRTKADWFSRALGISQQNAEVLLKQLVFDERKAVLTRTTIYGPRYKQVIDIVGTNGRTLPITVVWQRDLKDDFVRLITATPGVR